LIEFERWKRRETTDEFRLRKREISENNESLQTKLLGMG